MITDTCKICHQPISSEDGLLHWRHDHGDVECWTGDGATAFPSDPGWVDRMAAAYPDADLSAYRS